MMRRIILVLSILVVGAAAPARAWCEAACAAPRPDAASHCPSHDPAGPTTAFSTAGFEECPALGSAKPTAPGRFEAVLVIVAFDSFSQTTSAISAPMRIRPHSATTVFERSTPLRI